MLFMVAAAFIVGGLGGGVGMLALAFLGPGMVWGQKGTRFRWGLGASGCI